MRTFIKVRLPAPGPLCAIYAVVSEGVSHACRYFRTYSAAPALAARRSVLAACRPAALRARTAGKTCFFNG